MTAANARYRALPRPLVRCLSTNARDFITSIPLHPDTERRCSSPDTTRGMPPARAQARNLSSSGSAQTCSSNSLLASTTSSSWQTVRESCRILFHHISTLECYLQSDTRPRLKAILRYVRGPRAMPPEFDPALPRRRTPDNTTFVSTTILNPGLARPSLPSQRRPS